MPPRSCSPSTWPMQWRSPLDSRRSSTTSSRKPWRSSTGGSPLRSSARRARSSPRSTTPPGRCVSLHPDPNGLGHSHIHPRARSGPLRVGIGGPVGSGKTALVIALCRTLQPEHSVGVVTNDIYTREDAAIVRRAGVIDDDRILAVETGCCPHTAIRDDISANTDAIEALCQAHPDLDVVIVES